MNKLFELFEAERPVIPDSNADYYIGYNNGLVMAQAIVLKKDIVEVVRCKDCYYYGEKYPGRGYCKYFDILRIDNDFCSSGERKDNG